MLIHNGWAVASSLPLLPEAEAAPAGESLYLEVVLNEVATGRLAHVVVDEAGMYMPLAALRALSFRLDQTQDWIRLDAIKGLTARYDQSTQRLLLQAPLEVLSLDTRQLNTPGMEPLRVDQGSGGLLNYDLFAFRSEGLDTQLNGSGEFRAFGDWGLLSNSFFGFSEPAPGMKSFVRLESSWTYSDPEQLHTLQLGDAVSRNLSWSRATRFAGLQWRRNFALQPDLIVYPLPAFIGQATLPSSVELYVNGVRQYQDNVAPGPFEISALPNVNQLGEARLVVTDMLGRQTVASLPVYASNQMLDEGLTDYSLELGYVRQNFGIKSLDYADELMAMATLRRGLNEYFTVEAHAEGSDGLMAAGGGVITRLEQLGIFSAALALSDLDGQRGQLTRLSYEWQSRVFGFSMDSSRASRQYRDVASLSGQLPTRRTDRAFINFRFGRYGAVTTGYVRLDSPFSGKARLGSLFYSLPIGRRLNLFANVTEDLDDSNRTSVFLGLNYAWGRLSSTLSVSQQEDMRRESLQLSEPVPVDGGFGWRLNAEHGQQDVWQLEAGYRGDLAEVNAGIAEYDRQHRVFANLSGAIVTMGDALHLSRRVSDAFALVSSNGVPDVPVLLENREIGRTNDAGYYLLTPLSSYQRNRISINPEALPEDVYFGPIHRLMVPADRAGVTADFGLQQRRAAVLILQMEDGDVVPVGSYAYLQDEDRPIGYVGYDGQLYLQNLESQNFIHIRISPTQVCALEFSYQHLPGTVPTLGPLTCLQ